MAYAYPEDVHRLYIISYGIPVCPQGSQISANLMKSFKMTNFAPCGPIFKIRNSKQVYSKSYNQISDCIFLKPAISRQTSCKQIKSLIANLKSCLKVPCVPTVQCPVYLPGQIFHPSNVHNIANNRSFWKENIYHFGFWQGIYCLS